VRYAARVNGLDALAITKLDVLDDLDEIRICTAYRWRGEPLKEFPADLNVVAACEPVYETLPGWKTSTKGVRVLEDLPARARAYIARLEEASQVRAAIVSTGSDRDETIFTGHVLEAGRE
jgi:adenylosuccinate synthase